MLKEFLKNTSLKIPQIKKLFLRNHELNNQCNLLQREKTTLQDKINHLVKENQNLNLQLESALEYSDFANYYLALKQQNKLIELSNSYTPKTRYWQDRPTITKFTKTLEENLKNYQEIIYQFCEYEIFLNQIPLYSHANSVTEPHWHNHDLPGLDVISLYGLIAEKKPRYYVEIGSGASTKFVKKAIVDQQLSTKIISIDPNAPPELETVADNVIRQSLADMDYQFFENLSDQDILFVNSSYRSFSGSDTTIFFLEILESLPSQMIYGIRSIFLPLDYPEHWQDRYFNGQYLLAAYLMGGAGGDEILLPNAYLSTIGSPLAPLGKILQNPALFGIESWGAIFWMRKA